jgi:hypothetical protein
MSIRRWEMILELQKRKSNLGDVERVVLITDRIEELSGKQCFYTPNKPKKCSCLSTLQGDSNAMDAIGSYILFWAKLNPLQQKIMLIEKIKAIHVAERLIGRQLLCSTIEVTKPFQLPFYATEIAETNSKLSSICICKHSLAALHSYGIKAFISLEKHAKENTMPTHGNVGKLSKQTLDHRNNVVPLIKDFFVNDILPLAGPRPTRWTRDAVTKTIQVRDTADIEELDPGWSKRRLYGNFAWKLGWKIRATSKGTTVKEKRTDLDWLATEEPKQVCCRQSFNSYWSQNHPKLIVRKPSKDICSVCYKFSLLYRRKIDRRRRQAADNGNGMDSDSDDDEDDSDNDDPDDDELEQAMITVGDHIAEARSMRELLDFLHAQAQKCTEDGVNDEEMCIVLIIDFCQNMEMPSFNGTQPGETYYYSPMTVPTLGIVDGNTKENILYAYIYSEAEGNKGGNVVASLIMKYLRDRGLLDGKKRMKLTIVMDNCPGQNKNNHVVRLAPYLVAKGFFKKVGFLFLLAGHTKNWADKRFNNLKEDYRVTDLFCMDDLVKACNKK